MTNNKGMEWYKKLLREAQEHAAQRLEAILAKAQIDYTIKINTLRDAGFTDEQIDALIEVFDEK